MKGQKNNNNKNDLASRLLFSRHASFWKVLESWVTANSKSGAKSFFCISIDLGNDYICSSKCWSQFVICWCKSLAMATPYKNEIQHLRDEAPSLLQYMYVKYKTQWKFSIIILDYNSNKFSQKSTCIPNRWHYHISCMEGGKELRNLGRKGNLYSKSQGSFSTIPVASLH